MKKLIALLLALVMVLSLVACGAKEEPAKEEPETPSKEETPEEETPAEEDGEEAAPSEGEVVLTMMNIWCGADSKTAAWTDIINAFNAEYEGKYEVVLEDQADYDAYVEKMKALISTGDTPDLFTFKANLLHTYSATGELMDLTDAVYNSDIVNRIAGDTLKGAEHEGTLYCLPYETAIIPLMYNTNLMTDPIPTSYDELYTVAEHLRADGIYPIAQSTGSENWFSMLHYSYCLASVMGADIYNYAYDSAEWIEATELYVSLYAHSEDDMIGGDTSVTNGHFFNERAAIYCNGTWIVGRLGSEGVPGLVDNIDVSGSLAYNGKNAGGFMSIVQAYIGAAATDDPNRQAAVAAFLEFVTRADQVLPLCKSSGSLFAPEIDTAQLDEGLQTEIMAAAADATFLFDHIQDVMPAEVWAAYQENIEGLLLGEITAEDFCMALADAA